MELSHVEKQRTQLLQFVLLVIIMVLAAITFLSVYQQRGYLIPALTGLCLCACLYVIAKERRLKRLQSDLVDEIVEKEKQVADQKAKAASLESRLKELTDLYRAISAVNSAFDPGRTQETVLRAAIQLVGGDCGSIMVPDAGGEHLVIASAEGLSQAVVAQTRQPIGKGIAGWVAENLESVLLTGTADEDERFEDLTEREEEVLFSLAVPMVLRNKLIGVINLGSTGDESKDHFTDYDLRMVTIFAQHASVAIENARFMKENVGFGNSG
jgi:transcriptional regulator with GAF, ATPase, and Fis domain